MPENFPAPAPKNLRAASHIAYILYAYIQQHWDRESRCESTLQHANHSKTITVIGEFTVVVVVVAQEYQPEKGYVYSSKM